MSTSLMSSPVASASSPQGTSTHAEVKPTRRRDARGLLKRVLDALGVGQSAPERYIGIAEQYRRAGRHAEAEAMLEMAARLRASGTRV